MTEPEQHRYALAVAYDGGTFCGWQQQKSGLGVQEALTDAVDRLTGTRPLITASGRTDAGVHAEGQVVHVDLLRAYDPEVLLRALNAHLRPHPCSVLRAARVSHDFHARFSAGRRRYRYRLLCRRPACPLRRNLVWHVAAELNRPLLMQAAQTLHGKHDFSAFRAAGCTASSPIRTLDSILIDDQGEDLTFTLTARSFLYRQVRNTIGTLVDIARGKLPPDAVERALASGRRADAGVTAPAHGLYFVGTDYGINDPFGLLT